MIHISCNLRASTPQHAPIAAEAFLVFCALQREYRQRQQRHYNHTPKGPNAHGLRRSRLIRSLFRHSATRRRRHRSGREATCRPALIPGGAAPRRNTIIFAAQKPALSARFAVCGGCALCRTRGRKNNGDSTGHQRGGWRWRRTRVRMAISFGTATPPLVDGQTSVEASRATRLCERRGALWHSVRSDL